MTKKNSTSGKVIAWLTGIILLLGLIIIVGWHFFKKDMANPKSKIIKPLVTKMLLNLFNKATDSLYHIEYSALDLNINSGNGEITGFKLTPDSAVLKGLIAGHKAPNDIFTVSADKMTISNFGFVKTRTGSAFDVGSIVLKNPVIIMANKRRENISGPGKSTPPLLAKMMKDLLKIISVRDIVINNLNFTVINQNEGLSKITRFKNLNVKVNGLSADCPGNVDGQQRNKENPRALRVNLLSISTPDSLYHINFKDITVVPRQHYLFIGQTSIVPRLSVPAFYKAVKYDKDRFYMVFNKMKWSHIDVDQLIKDQQIHIGNIRIANSMGEIYNNYHWPRRTPPLRRHGYPHERLQRLALDLTIDTLEMHKGIMTYKIAAKKSGETAVLLLTHSEGRYYNITNNTSAKRKNHFAAARLHMRFMNAADLSLKYRFDLNDKSGAFSYTAKLGRMDGAALNPLSGPLAMINVKSANVGKMLMRVKVNERVAKGNIDLYYTGMKLDMLKPDKNADTLKKKKLLSFVANLALPNDNPKKDGKMRHGPIDVRRNPRASFLGFTWKQMRDGMSSLITGLDQHKDKPDKNFLIKAGSKIVKPQKTKSGKVPDF